MKTLLVAVNCSHSHSSLAIPYLQAACRTWLPSVSLPSRKEYNLRQKAELIARDLTNEGPDVIGFSCYIFNISLVSDIVRLVRGLAPSATILYGGPEMADGGEEFLSEPYGPDYVIRGEGEKTFVMLLRHLSGDSNAPLQRIPGLSWKQGDRVALNAPGPLIEPLDDIPSPFALGLNDPGKHFSLFEASRGCPFQCDFCLSGDNTGTREFSLKRVFDDIDIMAKQGIKEIRFVDRTFNAHLPRAIAILEHLERHYPAMRVHLELEPALLSSPDLLACLDRAEIHAEIGLQDLSPGVLQNVHRAPLRRDTLATVHKLCRETRASIHFDLIAGLPGSTLRGLYSNVAELTQFAPQELQIEVLKLLRGTKLRRSSSLRYDKRPPYAVVETPEMTESAVREAHLLSRLVDMFYNDTHLVPLVLCGHRILSGTDGFWPLFCAWWKERKLKTFGMSKIEKFDLFLLFIGELGRLKHEGSIPACAEQKLTGQWVFRRLCYANDSAAALATRTKSHMRWGWRLHVCVSFIIISTMQPLVFSSISPNSLPTASRLQVLVREQFGPGAFRKNENHRPDALKIVVTSPQLGLLFLFRPVSYFRDFPRKLSQDLPVFG